MLLCSTLDSGFSSKLSKSSGSADGLQSSTNVLEERFGWSKQTHILIVIHAGEESLAVVAFPLSY